MKNHFYLWAGALQPAPPSGPHPTERHWHWHFSLALRKNVASLCILYRIYYGDSSEELFELTPAASFRHGSTPQ